MCSVRVAHSCVPMDVGRRGGGKDSTDRASEMGHDLCWLLQLSDAENWVSWLGSRKWPGLALKR